MKAKASNFPGLRIVAAVLIPVMLLSLWPVQVWAASPPVPPKDVSTSALRGSRIPERVTATVRTQVPQEHKVPVVTEFSVDPQDAEFEKLRRLPEPLFVMTGNTDQKVNKELAAALDRFAQRPQAENALVLERYLEKYPESPWRVSLLTNLGIVYRAGGYWSKALRAWKEAWSLGHDESKAESRLMVDRAVAELAELYARLGRVSELEQLIQEVGTRELRGSAAQKLAGARQSLHLMRTEPEKSFRCGPFAISRIWASQHPDSAIPAAVLDSKCVPLKGTSLDQVRDFGLKLDVPLQIAKRSPGAKLITPAVVHWKEGHYAAIIREHAPTRYVIQDPTFGIDMLVSSECLDAEASGYFLVPKGELPAGWTAVDDVEGATIWGKGAVPPNSAVPPPGFGPTLHPGCGTGMAVYDVDPARVDLLIRDTPISYQPPRGPAINFTINYSLRDESSFIFPDGTNLGPQWNLNIPSSIWDNSGYISEAGENTFVPATLATLFGPGGGRLSFQMAGGSSNLEPHTHARLVIVAGSPDYAYEMRFPDGSKRVYGDMERGPGGAKFVLVSDSDASGNKTTYQYGYRGRLISVTDCLGQVSTINYVDDPRWSRSYLWVSEISDPFGRTATFTYNDNGQLWKITDPVGIVSEFTYGIGTEIAKLTTPYGETTFVKTDVGADRQLDITDPTGETERILFKYDSGSVSDASAPVPSGMDIGTSNYWRYRNTYFWNKKAFALGADDTQNAVLTHWLHTPDGAAMSDVVESVKAPLEGRIFYNYVGQTNPIMASGSARVKKVGRVLDDGKTQLYQLEYNARGKLTKSVTPADPASTPPVPARTTTYEYDSNLTDLLKVYQQRAGGATTDPFGAAADLQGALTYNAKHLPLNVKDADGQVSSFAYNSYGQVKTVTNAKGETTTFAYDRDQDANGETDGYLVSITGPVAGTTQAFEYDGFGRPWKITDSEGYSVYIEYEQVGSATATLNRPVKITYPDGTTEEVFYRFLDAEWMKDRMGRWGRQFYDPARRLVATQDPLGHVTHFQWCGCGSLEGIVDPAGNPTTWVHDVQGRVTDKVYADGSSIRYEYQPVSGRLQRVTDPRGQKTEYLYRIDGALTQVSYPGAVVATPSVEYGYDSIYARLSSIKVGGVDEAIFQYNPIVAVSTPPGTGAGQLQSVDGPLANDTISYTYDELGRPLSRSINGTANTTSLTYDNLGRVSNATSNLIGTFTYHYVNTTGRLDYVDYPNTQRVAFDYYPNTAPAGTGNGDRRLKQIKNLGVGAGGTGSVLSQFDYQYNRNGQISEWTQQHSGAAQGQNYVLGYDTGDQLQSAILKNASTGAVLQQFNYGYDAAGNRTLNQTDQAPVPSTYDGLNRLLTSGASTDAIGEMAFRGSLNEPGKLTAKNLTLSSGGSSVEREAAWNDSGEFSLMLPVKLGTLNQLELRAMDASANETVRTLSLSPPASAEVAFTYDGNGNTSGITGSGAPARSFIWDALDRLVEIGYPGTARKTKISYDSQDRWTEITEEDGGVVTQVRQFVWEGLEISEERDGAGNVVKRFFGEAEERNGASLFSVTDHLGSVREVSDSAGTIKARYQYDLWGGSDYDSSGHRTKITDDPAEPTFDSDWGFTGHFQHGPSRLAIAPFRQYDPASGRWLSQDPLGESGGLNLYGYVENNPANSVDPSGLFSSLNGLAGASAIDVAFLLGGGAVTTAAISVVSQIVENRAAGCADKAINWGRVGSDVLIDAALTLATLGASKGYQAAKAMWLARQAGVWAEKNIFLRGRIIERIFGANLPGNFPVIDRFAKGIATSIKSLDLRAVSYQDAAKLMGKLNNYVDSVARFKGNSWAGVVIDASQVKIRELLVVVPGVGSASQQAAIRAVVARAKSMGVQVIVTVF